MKRTTTEFEFEFCRFELIHKDGGYIRIVNRNPHSEEPCLTLCEVEKAADALSHCAKTDIFPGDKMWRVGKEVQREGFEVIDEFGVIVCVAGSYDANRIIEAMNRSLEKKNADT